jgi:hypothetical protein
VRQGKERTHISPFLLSSILLQIYEEQPTI